ncbi:MAG: hypothetical protein R3274_02400 [Desulfobacterales bacterium]|nr:hypothetical protein [Desulfobacterales bacterium]
MKSKHLTTAVLVWMLIAAPGFFEFDKIKAESAAPHHSRQNETASQDSHRPLSISKRTALVLLAISIMGVLLVRRKKKNPSRPVQHQGPHKRPEDRDQVFIDLNKHYLNLQYKMAQHQFSGNPPPHGLLEEISDIERKIRLISRALE